MLQTQEDCAILEFKIDVTGGLAFKETCSIPDFIKLVDLSQAEVILENSNSAITPNEKSVSDVSIDHTPNQLLPVTPKKIFRLLALILQMKRTVVPLSIPIPSNQKNFDYTQK